MRAFVKSLKRLYEKGGVTEAKLRSLLAEGKISSDEYEYITGEVYDG